MTRFLIVITSLVVSIAGGYLSLSRDSRVFPELPPGIYSGSIYRSGKQRGGESIPWFIAKREGEKSLSVSIGDIRISSQKIAPVDTTGRINLALFVGEYISGQQEQRMRFTGRQEGVGKYVGDFVEMASGARGTWDLAQVKADWQRVGSESELTQWAALSNELEKLEQEISEARTKVDQQRAVIEDLKRYVSDGDVLRKTADVRLGRTDSETEAAQVELRERQLQLDRGLRNFDLSQRVSPAGKLVFLSREAIERESRWINSNLRVTRKRPIAELPTESGQK